MFSDFVVKVFVFIVQSSNILGASPLRVDRAHGRFYVHFWSHIRAVHFWMCVVAYVIIILPTHLYILYITGQTRKINFMVVIILCGYVCVIVCGILTFGAHGWCAIINSLFKSLEKFEAKYLSDFDRDKNGNKISDKALLLVYVSIASMGYFNAIDCFCRPYASTYFLFGLDKRFVSWSLYILACGMYSSTAIAFTSACAMITCVIYILFVYNLPILGQELRIGRKFYKTNNVLRSNPVNLIIAWNSIELLIKICNVEVAFALLCMQIAIVCLVLFATSTLVYHWNMLDITTRVFLLFVSSIAVVCWSIFLMLAGLQYKWGRDTIASWRPECWPDKRNSAFIRKQRNAIRPFSLGYGKRYCIKPISVLAFLRSVSRNTFRALITYGKVLDLS